MVTTRKCCPHQSVKGQEPYLSYLSGVRHYCASVGYSIQGDSLFFVVASWGLASCCCGFYYAFTLVCIFLNNRAYTYAPASIGVSCKPYIGVCVLVVFLGLDLSGSMVPDSFGHFRGCCLIFLSKSWSVTRMAKKIGLKSRLLVF